MSSDTIIKAIYQKILLKMFKETPGRSFYRKNLSYLEKIVGFCAYSAPPASSVY